MVNIIDEGLDKSHSLNQSSFNAAMCHIWPLFILFYFIHFEFFFLIFVHFLHLIIYYC